MIEFPIKTWMCEACGYKQDFEPTQEAMNEHFNADQRFKLKNLRQSECPACASKGERKASLQASTREEDCIRIKIEEEADIAQVKELRDKHEFK